MSLTFPVFSSFAPKGVDTFKAKDVMSAPVTTFRHKEKVRNIVQTLIACRHHAFPVVLTPKDKAMLDSRNKCAALPSSPNLNYFFEGGGDLF